jgi:hypothetical protein
MHQINRQCIDKQQERNFNPPTAFSNFEAKRMSTTPTASTAIPRIVIVGGGAGGLELATSLGKTLGKKKQAEISLVDCSQIHIWKPLLHEVAAGTIDSHDDELSYLAQARANHFRFVLGRMNGLDREGKQIKIASMVNALGDEIVPVRSYGYDILVIAIGSLCNDFGIATQFERVFGVEFKSNMLAPCTLHPMHPRTTARGHQGTPTSLGDSRRHFNT